MKLTIEQAQPQEQKQDNKGTTELKARDVQEIIDAIDTIDNYLKWCKMNNVLTTSEHWRIAVAQLMVLAWTLGEDNAFQTALENDRKVRGLK